MAMTLAEGQVSQVEKGKTERVDRKAERAKEEEEFRLGNVEEAEHCPRPDIEYMRETIAGLRAKIAKKAERITELTQQIELMKPSRKALTETLHNKQRPVLDKTRSEKKALYNDLNALNSRIDKVQAERDAAQDALRSMKRKLQFLTPQQIDDKIQELEDTIAHGGLTNREERGIIAKIRGVRAQKDLIGEFNNLKAIAAKKTEAVDEIKLERVSVKDQISELKKKERDEIANVDTVRSEMSGVSVKIDDMVRERKRLYDSRKELYSEIDALRADFDEQFSQHRAYLKWDRYQRYLATIEEREEAEREAEVRRQEELIELASRDPFEEHKAVCDKLTQYLERLLPREGSTKEEAPVVAQTKVKLDGDDWLLSTESAKTSKKKKSKKKKKTANGALPHAPGVFRDFSFLSMEPPLMATQVSDVLDKLKALRESYDKEEKPVSAEVLASTLEGLRLDSESRAHRRASSNLIYEAERSEQVSEIEQAELESMLQRVANQKMAVDAMEDEQKRRVSAQDFLTVLTELNRMARIADAKSMAKQEMERAVNTESFQQCLQQLALQFSQHRVDEAKSVPMASLEPVGEFQAQLKTLLTGRHSHQAILDAILAKSSTA